MGLNIQYILNIKLTIVCGVPTVLEALRHMPKQPGEKEKCDLCHRRICCQVRGDKHAIAIPGNYMPQEARTVSISHISYC